MAEGRMLKRKITLSKKMASLKTDKAKLLWFYMLPFTDVDGRIEADCEDIRDEIVRKQRKGFSLGRIEECLQDLHRVGLIILYTCNGRRYLEFTRFDEEQKNRNRDREAESEIPAPTQGAVSEQSETTPIKLSKDKLSKVKLSKDKYKGVDFPEKLNTPEFKAVWEMWLEYRRAEKHKPVGPRAAEMQLATLSKLTVNEAISTIETSIQNSWQGLFPEKESGNMPKKPKLLPIVGKTCSLQDCRLPAVYRDTSGSYDHYYCEKHLPSEVKEVYG